MRTFDQWPAKLLGGGAARRETPNKMSVCVHVCVKNSAPQGRQKCENNYPIWTRTAS